MEDEAALRMELDGLKREHRALDQEIAALAPYAAEDALLIQRLKKRKLALKDRIAALEDLLYPDIIA